MKKDACWISYIDEDDPISPGIIQTLFTANGETFCEDCIEKAVEYWQKRCNDNDLFEDDISIDTKITYQIESSVERRNQLHCDECDEPIECDIIDNK